MPENDSEVPLATVLSRTTELEGITMNSGVTQCWWRNERMDESASFEKKCASRSLIGGINEIKKLYFILFSNVANNWGIVP